MNSVVLNLVAVRPETVLQRTDQSVIYDVAYEDLDLAFEPFPEDIPFGLYRLSIEINAAESIKLSAQLRVESNGLQEPYRVIVEKREGYVDFFFVLMGNEHRPVLTIAVDGPSRLSIGVAHLSRVSTTRWRSRRILQWFKTRTTRPQILWEDTRSLVDDVRHGGLREIHRRYAETVNPSIWSERKRFDQRLSRIVRATSVTNRDFLARLPLNVSSNASSLSIVIPVYRTPRKWLEELVTSLRHQTNLDFDVIFVLDGPQPDLKADLKRMLQGGVGYQILTLPENRGVAAATNAGIRATSGEFVLVVDHDDVLERHLVEAFHRASCAISADIYFADEVIADENMQEMRSVASRGTFDIRYYLSHPYIVHPIFVRRAIAEQAGLFDEALRVSHDVDFFLRCVARADRIVQIPLVLYFWRTHEASLGHKAIDSVYENTSAAVRSYIRDQTKWPSFEVRAGVNFNELEIRPPIPEDIRVAIVIPTKNGLSVLRQCLSSIQDRVPFNRVRADVFVIDHESDDPQTLSYLRSEQESGRISVVPYVGKWNYSSINNTAIATQVSSRGYTHIVLMNNDIELVTNDWLDRMSAEFSWGDVGVVGCCLLYPKSTIQHAGVVIGLGGPADHIHRFAPYSQYLNGPRAPGPMSSFVATRDYSAVTAALMMVSLKEFEAVGGLDEKLAIGFNDTDLCLRIGARGFHSTYLGGVVAIHHESVTRKSTGGVEHPEDSAFFLKRYDALIKEGDPYYGSALDWTRTTYQYSEIVHKNFGLRSVRRRSSGGTFAID
ncbi:glycosyltransferase family 2 protein [Aureimonas sp. AU40]|uniref:glycosyltransferase family 2 protein n=1 Tax=Aureimonas sp. AU40 TaxID=1637747 RepID=UPI0009EC1EEC|nr:glycosyltransferase [Aureimonas sp. AU40]